MVTEARLVNPTIEGPDVEGYVDLRDLVARLWRGRWWVIASVVVVTGALSSAAFLMTPVYEASTVLISADADRSTFSGSLNSAFGSLGGLASLAGINIGGVGSETEEAMAVLRSRQFTEAFIRDENLMPVLFADAWDKQSKAWLPDAEPPTPAQAYKYFDGSIRSVAQDKKTGLITLRIQWKDREQAAAWANELVERLNAEMRSRAIEQTNASIDYLEKELKKTSLVGTRDAISRLIEAQMQQRMLANVTREYAFRVVDKAMAPDRDDPIKPRKMLMMAAGPVLGAAFGITAVLVVGWLASILASVRDYE